MATPSRRENTDLQRELPFALYQPQYAATTTLHVFKARVACKVTRVEYANPTGLVAAAGVAFKGEIKNGATVLSTVFNTDSAAGGATLAANALLTPALSAAANALNLAAGDTLDLVLTRTGASTLPDGHLRVYVTEI